MEIIGYPDYLIYDDGRVFSKKNDRFLKSCVNSTGYLLIRLWNEEDKKTFTIHRLVALHYIPNPENKPFIDHISRDKQDNRKENLIILCPNHHHMFHSKHKKEVIPYINEYIKNKWGISLPG